MAEKKLLKRIRLLEKLTPSEAKIADYLARNYADAVFDNVTTISGKTGISKATVVRFMAKLGYEKFSDFHRDLKNEIVKSHDSLHIRYSLQQKMAHGDDEDIIANNFANIVKNLDDTHAQIDREVFLKAARLMIEAPGKLYITGQRSSFSLASLFFIMIRRIRPQSVLIEPQGDTLPDYLMDVTADDVLFAVFRHPYARQTHTISHYFADQKAKIILLTDSEFSPLADIATYQIPINTEGVSVFTSSAAVVATLESLNIAALRFCGSDISNRLERAEKLYQQFDVFCSRKSLRFTKT